MTKRTGKQIRDETGELLAVAGKSANGMGTVFYRAARKRWEATYRDSNGTRRTVTAPTRAAVVERRDAKLAELAATAERYKGGVLGRAPTVADLAGWWVERCADVRPGTLASYRRQLVLIVDRIGDVPLEAFDAGRVRLLLTDLAETMAADTVRNVRARLRQVAEEGVTLGYLTANPVVGVKAPKPKVNTARGPKRVLTIDETHRLVEACHAHRLGAAVALLFLLGNRSSEVLGLAWQDIDLDAASVTVRRGSTYASGVGQRLDETKTRATAGVRMLPPTAVALLRQRRKVQAVERLEAGPLWATTTYKGEPLDMVFTGADGSLVLTQSLYKAVRDCCELAGVDPEGVGSHTGRRSVITALFADGAQIEDVAALVGHSEAKTTSGYVQHYGDRPKHTAHRAAELLDPAVSDA